MLCHDKATRSSIKVKYFTLFPWGIWYHINNNKKKKRILTLSTKLPLAVRYNTQFSAGTCCIANSESFWNGILRILVKITTQKDFKLIQHKCSVPVRLTDYGSSGLIVGICFYLAKLTTFEICKVARNWLRKCLNLKFKYSVQYVQLPKNSDKWCIKLGIIDFELCCHPEFSFFGGVTLQCTDLYEQVVFWLWCTELGGCGLFLLHLHARHHASDPGSAHKQLRDPQNPSGPWGHTTHATWREVSNTQPATHCLQFNLTGCEEANLE